MLNIEDEFREGDKVLCVDDTYSESDKRLNYIKLEKGKIYNVFNIYQYNIGGEKIDVTGDWRNGQWHKSRFKLIKRYR